MASSNLYGQATRCRGSHFHGSLCTDAGAFSLEVQAVHHSHQSQSPDEAAVPTPLGRSGKRHTHIYASYAHSVFTPSEPFPSRGPSSNGHSSAGRGRDILQWAISAARVHIGQEPSDLVKGVKKE